MECIARFFKWVPALKHIHVKMAGEYVRVITNLSKYAAWQSFLDNIHSPTCYPYLIFFFFSGFNLCPVPPTEARNH